MSYSNSGTTSATLMKWNTQLKDRRGAQNYLETLIEAARMATITADGMGIVWALMSESEFEEMFPDRQRNVLLHPGNQPLLAADRVMWEYKLRQFDEQQVAIRNMFIHSIGPNGVPSHIQSNMRDGKMGMATRDIAYIYNYLRDNYTDYLEEDIDDLEIVFDKAWSPGVDIRAFTSEAMQAFRELKAAGCPINEFHANRRMKAKFPALMWQPCWTQHSLTHETMKKFNVKELAEDIIKFHDQHLPRTPAGLVYHAAAAVAIEDEDTRFANQMARFQASQPKSKQWKSYCWTHGPNNTMTHTSLSCTHPAAGHVRTATLTNKCGGHA